jgi:hypothetical protein
MKTLVYSLKGFILMLFLIGLNSETLFGQCDIGGTVIEAGTLPYYGVDLTTCGAGDNLNSENITSCGSSSYLQGEEIVFIFEAPVSQLYHISLTGASANGTSLKLYDGCPLISQGGICVDRSESGSSDRILSVELEAGKTYYLVISDLFGECFNFNLSIDVPETCPEPGEAGWQAISLPFYQEGLTTCGAGDDFYYANINSCGATGYLEGEELVYIFEAPVSQLYHISLTGASADGTSLKLYDGCPLISQGGICVDRSESGSSDRIFPVELEAGKTYYLVISDLFGECFNFNLSIDVPETCPEPGEAGWQAISLPFYQEGLTTCGAGDDFYYANINSCGATGYLDGEELVYIFEAPVSQLYHISLTGASADGTSLKLYDGCPLISQGGICVDRSESGSSDRIFPVELEAGKTYYLVISDLFGECFNFNLSIDVPETCPEPGEAGWQAISLPFYQEGLTTCGAGNDLYYANINLCGSASYLEGEELVYIFEAPVSQLYHISLTGASADGTSLKLYDGCPLISQGGNCVDRSESGSSDRIFPVELEAGKTYYLVISDLFGECFDFNLEIKPLCQTPVPVIEQPDPVCKGEPVPELTVTNPEGAFSWYADQDLTQLLATGESYTPRTDTTITLYVTNTMECESGSTPVVVEIISPPVIETVGISGTDNYVCEGASFSLIVNDGTSWSWSTGETTSSITKTATQSGTWSVVTQTRGCTLNSEIFITVLENTAPDPVSGMTPPENTVNVSLSPTLSWIPGNNSTSFDVYLWEAADGDRPEKPVYKNIQSPQITFRQDELVPATDYNWQILSRNGECGITEGAVQTFSTQDLPNLIVSDLAIQSNGYTGEPVSVTFQVLNVGNAGTGNDGWNDALFLSIDDSLDLEVDILLGTWSNEKFLLPGESYTQTVEVTIPKQYLGEVYLIVAANYNCEVKFRGGGEDINFLNLCDHLLNETTLADNWRVNASSISLVLPPLPDLHPTDFATPEISFAGDTINISYSVENIGQAIANSTSLRLVRNMCAAFRGGSVGDPAKSGSVTVVVGDAITNCLLAEPYWLDMVFFSESPVHDPENDILIATETISFLKENFIANGNAIPEPFEPVFLSERIAILDDWKNTPGYLDAGAGYQRNIQAVLPNCIDGEYYLHLVSDYSGWIWEFDRANNAITKTLQVIATPPPDLVVTDGTIPDNPLSGEPVTLDYEIYNDGAGKPAAGYWVDYIYLLPTPGFDEQTAILLNSNGVLNGDTLQPGQSMLVSTTFRIPNGLSGQHYLYIHTNAAKSVCEFDPENNYYTIPLVIELSPSPDLVVNDLSITDETNAESYVNLSYTTLNQGDGNAEGPWRDSVYLSQSPDFDPATSLLFFGYDHSDTLQPGLSKTTDVEVRIPSIEAGDWYIYVQTNAGETIYEHEGSGNNVFRSGPWQIKQRLESDIEVSDFTVTGSADAGQEIAFSYNVTNTGLAPPNAFNWDEIIYLSDDPTLSENSIRLIRRIYTGEEFIPGAVIERTGTVRIPNGTAGTKYIHVMVDDKNAIENDVNRENNIIAVPIAITQPPTPDLQLVSVDLPALFYAGEPVWITYTASNQGAVATQTEWVDRMGASLNREGVPFRSNFKRQDLQIAPGGQYTDSILVTMPAHYSGTYYFSVSLNAWNSFYEHDGEGNNITLYPVTVLQPEPADLVVSGIVSPANAIPGRMTSYSFTLTNQGINPVKSDYTANLYLEGNDFPGFENTLLWTSERPSFTPLEPGNSITFNVDRAFPGLKDGPVNTRVLANASRNVKETDYTNNEMMGDSPISSTLTVLPVNTEISDTLAMGSSLFYKLNLPDNADLRVWVRSNLGFAENAVFLRYDNIPTGPLYDVRNFSGNMASPVLLLPGTREGENYLKIQNFNARNMPTQDVTIRADVLPFGIDSITPSVMGQGRVTSQVFGAGFRAGAVAELLSQNNTPVLSGRILRFISSMQLEIRWQLENTPEGIYHLRVTNPGGESVLLSNAVVVEPAKEPDVALIPVYERIIGDRNPATVGLVFRNNSNVDASVVKVGIFYRNVHKLVSISKQEKIFTLSQLLSGLSEVSADSFPDFMPHRDEQGNHDIIPLYVHDLAPGQKREMSLTFENFPFAAFSIGVGLEAMTDEAYLNFIASGAKDFREFILNGFDIAGELGFTPALRAELYDIVSNESLYFHSILQQYINAGLIAPEDTIGFKFDPVGLDTPKDYADILGDQKTIGLNGSKGDTWGNEAKNLFPIPLPGPDGGGYDPSPDPNIPGPRSCESFGTQAIKLLCNSMTVITCAAAAGCIIAPPVILLGLSNPGTAPPTLAVSVELFILCKSAIIGCGATLLGTAASIPDILCMEVLKSCDPNEIQGPTGIGDQQFIAQKDRVNYTVYFENDPELASAAAKQVRISVPISEFANPLSARLSTFGFAGYTFEVPQNAASVNQRIDLSQDEGYFLDVIGGLDIQQGELFWLITTIDPATGQIPVNPFDGFLQINDSTGIGEGFVKFSLTPHESSVTGDTMAHFADIYFDLNPPITTNTHFNTIDAMAPTTVVEQLPGISDGNTLTLHIEATDDDGGSGLETTEVYVAKNGQEPVLLGKDRATEWLVAAETCDSLAFFARSIDKVGNAEPIPDLPQAITQLGRDGVSAGADTTICAGNEIILTASEGASYLWSNGETTQSISVKPDSNAVYSVMVVNAEGCPGLGTVSVTLENCSAVEEDEHSESLLRVYPNPSTGNEIFAEFSGLAPGKYQISLFDQNGKHFYEVQLQMYQDGFTQSIPVQDLPPGTYLLEIKGKEYQEVKAFVITGK